MSAGIETNDTMAYLGKKPWHDLATAVISETDSLDEAWAKGGLTWSISKRQNFRADKDGKLVSSNRVSIVRDDTDEELGTASPDWEAYQNTEILEQYIRPMYETGLVKLETLGSLGNGRKVFAYASIKGAVQEIVKNDPVWLGVVAAQGHDGTMGLFLGGTAVRPVCENTVAAALGAGGQLRVRHTKNMRNTVAAVRDALMKSMDNFGKTCEVFKALAGKNFNNEQLTTYLNTLFPKNRTQEDIKVQAEIDGANEFAALLNRPWVDKRTADQVFSARAEVSTSRAHDRILEILEGSAGGQAMPGVKGTGWAAYNAVTNFLTHERGRSADSRMSALVFGGGNGIGAAALTAATDAFLR